MSDTGWETYSADIVLASCKRCTFTMTDCGDVPCPVCTCDTLRTRAERAERLLERATKLLTIHAGALLLVPDGHFIVRDAASLSNEIDDVLHSPSAEPEDRDG